MLFLFLYIGFFFFFTTTRGTIHTLKLSPNLRLKIKPTKKQLQMTQYELEALKLERLLSFVREPPVLIPPADVRAKGNEK